MVSKTIKPHLDRDWVKGFSRYVLMSHIINSSSWSDLEVKLSKIYKDDYQKKCSDYLMN